MLELTPPVLKWIEAWEKKAAYGGRKAIVNLGGIRGGHAWRASRTPEKTDLFLDVRVPPTMQMAEARRDIQSLFFDLEKSHADWGLEFETYVSLTAITSILSARRQRGRWSPGVQTPVSSAATEWRR
jgi:hypothetical protein